MKRKNKENVRIKGCVSFLKKIKMEFKRVCNKRINHLLNEKAVYEVEMGYCRPKSFRYDRKNMGVALYDLKIEIWKSLYGEK